MERDEDIVIQVNLVILPINTSQSVMEKNGDLDKGMEVNISPGDLVDVKRPLYLCSDNLW